MSAFLESVRWNACMHRLDLGLYSHPKEFLGSGVRTHVNSKKRSPLSEAHRRVGPATLHHAGHRANTLPIELFRPPPAVRVPVVDVMLLFVGWLFA